MKINVNGRIVPEEKAKISALDYGFLYGYGLFETMRAYDGKIFRLQEHLDRLFDSANAINLRITQTPDTIREAAHSTLVASGLGDAYVRATITRGIGKPRLQLGDSKSSFTVIVDELPDLEDKYRNGVKVAISADRVNNHSKLSGVKSLNFLASAIARQEALDEGADDAILLNCDGLVAGASTSNIFLLGNGKLRTPSKNSGILQGITRGAVMSVANRTGIESIETDVTVEDITCSEECFLTNSISEIMPVVEVGGKGIGTGKPGALTKRLHRVYKKLVLEELGIK